MNGLLRAGLVLALLPGAVAPPLALLARPRPAAPSFWTRLDWSEPFNQLMLVLGVGLFVLTGMWFRKMQE